MSRPLPRVLFVTGEYPPMLGGVGAYTHELAHALARLGHPVAVVTHRQAARAPGAAGASAVAVYPWIPRWGWGALFHVARLARHWRAEWVHVQYQTAAYGMHPAIHFAPDLWRRWGFRVAWTYHDLRVPYLFPKAGHRLRRWITWRPGRVAHRTVVTNEADRRQLAPSRPDVVSIPIGSNIRGRRLSASQRAARRAQRGYLPDQLVVGYFGFLNPSKGGVTLIQTLDRLVRAGRDAHLLMIGETVGASDPSNRAYLAELERLIAALELGPRVRWTGPEPEHQVAADLNIVDVLLMPYVDGASTRRGTLMAGLANGCAIVTTEPQAPLPELVHGRDLLYVPPEDPEAAAQAVLQIADRPDLAARLRENACRRSQLFTWETIARGHQRLYRSPEAPLRPNLL